MASILFVDDELSVRQNYRTILLHYGFEVTLASSVTEAQTYLNGEKNFDLLITDIRMGDNSGLDLLRESRILRPEIDVIVLTGHGEIATAIEAIRLGASDYLTKDTDYKEILLVVNKTLEKRSLTNEIDRLRVKLRAEYSFDRIIGKSKVIVEVLEIVKRVAPTDSRVLLTGESGTGKELIAETIHTNSTRKNAPFIAINCGAIPAPLQESELFGYVKGAFTGAVNDKKGILESAHRGTIFLDEIGEMSLETQVKLLRFLEGGDFIPIGTTTPRKSNVRIIAATNRDLAVSVREKSFREDLYYRLKVVSLHLPRLRERREDIPLIADSLVANLNDRTHRRIIHISPLVLEALQDYSWPGNIRELRNVLERAMIFSDTDTIDLEHLPEELFKATMGGVPVDLARDSAPTSNDSIQSLDEVERQYILSALEKYGGNKLVTARQLKIATTTLYRKLRQYGIE